MTDRPVPTSAGWPRGFEEHRAEQAGIGLRMTHAERLRWLEETMATLRRWQGRSRMDPAKPGKPR